MADSVILTVDRAKGTVKATGDCLFIRDPDVRVTLVGVSQDDIDAALVLELYDGPTLLSSVTEGWTVDEEGNAVGTLSTNTDRFIRLFDRCDPHCVKHVSVKAYTANPLNPIFNSRVNISNFTSEASGTLTEILLPSESLAAVEADIALIKTALNGVQAQYEAAIADAVNALRDSLREEFASADEVVSGAIGEAITEHNSSTDAHADIRNAIIFCGSGIYIQCNKGALADNKWRKLVPSEPNEFGEYMMMIKQSPTYTYNEETHTWEEEA